MQCPRITSILQKYNVCCNTNFIKYANCIWWYIYICFYVNSCRLFSETMAVFMSSVYAIWRVFNSYNRNNCFRCVSHCLIITNLGHWCEIYNFNQSNFDPLFGTISTLNLRLFNQDERITFLSNTNLIKKKKTSEHLLIDVTFHNIDPFFYRLMINLPE